MAATDDVPAGPCDHAEANSRPWGRVWHVSGANPCWLRFVFAFWLWAFCRWRTRDAFEQVDADHQENHLRLSLSRSCLAD
jgi:hypothetical protein